MDVVCSETVLEAQEQISSTIDHLIKMVSMFVNYSPMLSVPLPLVIPRSSDTRFLLLIHLLSNNLQQLIRTIKAVLLGSWEGLSVTKCLMFSATNQTFSLVCKVYIIFVQCTVLLVTRSIHHFLLSFVDRVIDIKWPLHYEFFTCTKRKGATVPSIWTLSVLLSSVGLCFSLTTMQVQFTLPHCRYFVLTSCPSMTSALRLYCTVGTALVLPLCHLTILACFCLLCWDIRAGLFSTTRAYVTLTLQAVQTILFSIPVIMGSYLIPGYLHNDAIDIATIITYNLGASLIPLVYGYCSRELQQRIRQAAHLNKHSSQNP